MRRSILPHPTNSRIRPAGGFTMLELLVVMGIIIFLAGLLVMGVSSALGSAKERATKATIRKIDGLLTQRMDAFTRAIKVQDDSANNSGLPQYATTSRTISGNNLSRAKVLGRKVAFRDGFPQSLAEAGKTPAAGDDPRTQSSEAMYIFLTEMEAFGSPPVDADQFTSSEVADTDGDGLMEFIDAWGNPIRFYRTPTRLIRPAPSSDPDDPQTLDNNGNYAFPVTSNYAQGIGPSLFFANMPSDLTKDADDQLGVIVKPRWRYGSGSQMSAQEFERRYHTPDTWSLPLILSAGPDGELGIFEASADTSDVNLPSINGSGADSIKWRLAQPDYNNLEAMLDNISNRNLQP